MGNGREVDAHQVAMALRQRATLLLANAWRERDVAVSTEIRAKARACLLNAEALENGGKSNMSG